MTSSSVLSSNQPRLWALIWLFICVLLGATLTVLVPQSKISGSVLALLPAQTMGHIPPALNDGFMQRLDRQLVWMVSPAQGDDPAAAKGWLERLQGLSMLTAVKGPMDAEQQKQWGQFFYQHRNGMIDPQTRQRLSNGGEGQANWVLAQLYSAFAGVSGVELKNDPLMLVRGSQLALQQNASRLRMKNGWLVAQDDQGRSWYFIHGELNGSSYNMQQSHQVVTDLAALETDLQHQFPGAKVMSRGTLFYSNYASQQAKHDVSTLGIATIIGVLLLIFGVFRSLRPLLLCALSVGMGALAGSTVTLLIFGELHLMTLVMSISIVGISADYTLYYLTERMVHGRETTTWQSLHKVLPALMMALSTTVIAYLIMMLAPFPGIRQLAVFAAAGLTASCLTVVCWYPWLARGLPVRPVPLMLPLMCWLAAWRSRKMLYIGLPVVLSIFSVAGLLHLKVNDDIAQLQSLPQDIQQQEKAITALTGQGIDQKWFVVYGDNPEQTLQRLEHFVPKLDQAKKLGWLGSYRLLPLSSLKQQHIDLTLLKQASPKVVDNLAVAGITKVQVDVNPMPVTPETWLNSVASEGWALMWLSLPDGRSGVLVPTDGVKNTVALKQMTVNQAGVSWVDRKASFDQMFAFYRAMLGWLLLGAVVAIAFTYVMRLGLRRGLISVLPSLLSLGCGLAVLTFSGHSLNLFSLLALVLVLGIGINYTLFFSNPRGTPLTSLLAVSVAMSTSLLTLGMMVFSSTQAISSFGIVLCSGIFTAFLLSPLAMPPRRRGKKL
ncbi:MMPL family transporter [Ewingella sp. S1.OA.A_B6]